MVPSIARTHYGKVSDNVAIPTDQLNKKQVGMMRFLLGGINLIRGVVPQYIKMTVWSCIHWSDLYLE